MSTRDEYKRVVSDDAKYRIIFSRAPSGLFTWEVQEYVTDEDGTYWTPCGGGGLYDSAEAVERSASLELPWLRSQNSN